METVGRNSLCPCNSGKKYKACCQNKCAQEVRYSSVYGDSEWLKIRKADGVIEVIFERYIKEKFGESVYDAAWEEFKTFGTPFGDREAYSPYFKSWMYYSWPIESGFLPTDEVTTIAQLCLEECPELFTDYQKRLIRAINKTPFSFFLIEDVIPAQRLFLKDILLQNKVEVKECNASKEAKKGTIFFCRPVRLEGQSIIIGMAQYAVPNRFFQEITDCRDWLQEVTEVSSLTPQILLDYESEMRELYFDVLEQAFQPARFTNTDGDPFIINEIFYDLKCTPKEVFDALVILSPNSYDAQWEEADEVNIVWGTDEKTTSLGSFTIRLTELKVFVNSNERAVKAKEVVQNYLGSKVSFKNEKITPMTSSDDLSQENREVASNPTPYTPEEIQIVKDYMANHWIKWLDSNIPLLGNLTPRQASKLESGRERLKALFLDFESKNQSLDDADKEYQKIDLEFLRQELDMLS